MSFQVMTLLRPVVTDCPMVKVTLLSKAFLSSFRTFSPSSLAGRKAVREVLLYLTPGETVLYDNGSAVLEARQALPAAGHRHRALGLGPRVLSVAEGGEEVQHGNKLSYAGKLNKQEQVVEGRGLCCSGRRLPADGLVFSHPLRGPEHNLEPSHVHCKDTRKVLQSLERVSALPSVCRDAFFSELLCHSHQARREAVDDADAPIAFMARKLQIRVSLYDHCTISRLVPNELAVH
ncbi:hypothetical protein EYF80_006794 [Liparis tanakae]|uniref:Uncharacterized protein n=1 Tax=Liparis tanakae TaxID=230148 RepID=A0A4Z2IYJ7_9TELE|nr:hypothetical protein EYF80_006794 [Liparis tanakae]